MLAYHMLVAPVRQEDPPYRSFTYLNFDKVCYRNSDNTAMGYTESKTRISCAESITFLIMKSKKYQSVKIPLSEGFIILGDSIYE